MSKCKTVSVNVRLRVDSAAELDKWCDVNGVNRTAGIQAALDRMFGSVASAALLVGSAPMSFGQQHDPGAAQPMPVGVSIRTDDPVFPTTTVDTPHVAPKVAKAVEPT